jgi:hypothetical protein
VEFLRLAHRDVGKRINVFHAVAGIGSGKTIAGALLMHEAATTYNRGLPMAWTAPTYGMIDKFIIPAWRSTVPGEGKLWRYYKGADNKRIEIEGGATIYLLSREKPDRILGMTLAGILEDEIGTDKDRYAWDVATGRIRPMANVHHGRKFHVGISTPRTGWFQDEIQQGGNPWVHWTSYDNPYDDRERIEQIETQFGEKYARRELYADFVQMSGIIWEDFLDSLEGNRVEGGHDANQPFILAGDLGIHSAWCIIQRRGNDDVITAEYISNTDGAKQTFERVDRDYGKPSKVIMGSDQGTRWVGDGALKPVMYVRQQWGKGVQVRSPQGNQTDKGWQHHVMTGRICNSRGERRLKVAMGLKSHDRDPTRNARGCLDMFKGDAWPDVPRTGESLPKDKKYEHIRDALLYYCICQYPPRFRKQG